MWRLMNMTFYGKSRVKPEVAAHIHESPASMTVPLMLLAAGSVLAGWLGTPKLWNLGESFRGFERWLEPAFASAAIEAAKEGEHAASIEWILMGVSVAFAIIGIVVARWFYHHKPEIPDTLEKQLKPLHGLLYNKWYVDEIYDFLFVNGLVQGRRPGAGRLRPQRGGWRRQRRRLADPLQLHGVDLVGHLDRRRRGALQRLLREDALLPGVHPADRAACRPTRSSWWSERWPSWGITSRGNYMDQHLLSIVLLTPLAGLFVLLLLPSGNKDLIRVWANLAALAGFLVSLPLVWRFRTGVPGFQFEEKRRLDPLAGRPLPPGHGRHQPAAGDAHHPDGLPRHALLLDARFRTASRNTTPCSCCCRRA